MRRAWLLPLLAALVASLHACAAGTRTIGTVGSGEGGSGGVSGAGGATGSGGVGGTSATPMDDDGGLMLEDASSEEPPVSPDAACAATTEEAVTTALPVDILWVVDNSASMEPAIAQIKKGLNSFAALIAAKNLDYNVIMLSLRGAKSPVTIGGSARYPVCIPAPLAGDHACGNGPRFFQSSIDIRSTQPLEQLLGTLGQTDGYAAGNAKGGEAWASHLRAEATKTIVVVTDDNSRLSATQLETFPGGKNPFNSLTLPPGILDPSWNGLFKGYLFDGIYGWGSSVDPSVACTYSDKTQPVSPGPTYSTLVQKTGGVRAKICDGSAAWQPFFAAIANAVIATAKLSCELVIPSPKMGVLDPAKINVAVASGDDTVYIPGVASAAACGDEAGWYYDNPLKPTKVSLCPSSCDAAQVAVLQDKPGHINVLFGCQTIPK